MDPVANNCQQSPNFSCPPSNFLDISTNKCLACSQSCKNCTSMTACTLCIAGFSLNNGQCVPTCGNGIIDQGENCDSGSIFTPGCIYCQIVSGYNCNGQPSTCSQIQINIPPNKTNTNKAQLFL